MKTPKRTCKPRKTRKGTIAAVTALLLVAIVGLVACALDIGYIEMTRTQLQSVADASSLAGGTELLPGLKFTDFHDGAYYPERTPEEVTDAAKLVAVEYAGHNRNGDVSESFIDSDRDVKLGKATYDSEGCACWQKTPAEDVPADDPSGDRRYFNYIEVTPLRNQAGSADGDGPLPLFFAQIFGFNEKSLRASATAAILPANGFQVNEGSDETANVMPFAFNEKYWRRLKEAQEYYHDHPNVFSQHPNWNTGPQDTQLDSITDSNGDPLFGEPNAQLMFDQFTRSDTGAVSSGSDGHLEIDIFTGKLDAAGNWGTVDFGSSGNSASDVRRQIRDGLSANDLSHYDNNEIVLDPDDPFNTGGDTGEYSPFKAALDDVVGQCKAIALFTSASGSGDNANFELVEFVAATVVFVNLTGNPSNREVRVQPCTLVDDNGVPDTDNGGEIDDDTTIFTNLILIR